jgi:hypothetical protein
MIMKLKIFDTDENSSFFTQYKEGTFYCFQTISLQIFFCFSMSSCQKSPFLKSYLCLKSVTWKHISNYASSWWTILLIIDTFIYILSNYPMDNRLFFFISAFVLIWHPSQCIRELYLSRKFSRFDGFDSHLYLF